MNQDSEQRKIWFPAKRYGYGWGLPNCWQGWVVFAVYAALIAAGAFFLERFNEIGLFIAYVSFLSGGLIFVCWRKGEKPGWRWGRK